MVTTVITIVCICVIVGLTMLLLWPRSGPWGINLSKVRCPRCGSPLPRFRKPLNERQALWGGWTCSKCNCEVDKYGVEVDVTGRP